MELNEEQFIIRFGTHLRQLRTSRKLSQEQLANDADIPINQIGRIERGEIKTTIGTLYVIANALQVTVQALFDFEIED
ncbi:helix-turn-helix domain-containing protein [Pontimicrobium sp. MEBiC06410]